MSNFLFFSNSLSREGKRRRQSESLSHPRVCAYIHTQREREREREEQRGGGEEEEEEEEEE